MKKSNLIKVVTILLISVMVILFATTVNAADENGYNDKTNEYLEQFLNGNNTNNDSKNTNTNNAANNTNKAANNTNNANNVANNTNKSVYNNTNSNLPKTGIEDSIPVAMLVVIFGISAVYAYKKVSDYKNI